MIIYIAVSLIILILALLNYELHLNKRYFFLSSGFVLILFSGLRGDFCADYKNYVDYFTLINNNYSFNEIIHTNFYNEKGFVLLNKIIGVFTNSNVIFIIILSSITIFMYYVVLKKYSKIPFLSILLLVGIGSYYDSFNVTRQILSASILFYGINYMIKKDFIRYCMLACIAGAIHRTAFLVIPFYFLLITKVTKKKIILYCVISLFFYLELPRIIGIIRVVFPAYENYSEFLGYGNIKWIFLPVSISVFVVAVTRLYKVDSKFRELPETTITLNALFLYVLFTFLGLQSQMVARMATFVQPFVLILIPNILYYYKNKKEKYILVVIIIILAVLYPYITLKGTGYDPYYFIWESRNI